MVLAIVGLISAAAGTVAAAALVPAGALLWVAGHWLFAFKHHHFCSPLARRLFQQALPGRLDPTRRWGVPTVSRDPHA